MRVPVFAPADVACALLLLSVLILAAAARGLGPMEAGSGFVIPAGEDLPVSPSATAGRVNPNRANAERLATVPGMDPAMAEAIVRFRGVHGPFRRLADLERIPGIGAKRLRAIRPYLTLEEERWPTK